MIVGNCSKFIIIPYLFLLLIILLFAIYGTLVNAVVAVHTLVVTAVYVAVAVAAAAVTVVVAVSAVILLPFLLFSLRLVPVECFLKSSSVSDCSQLRLQYTKGMSTN